MTYILSFLAFLVAVVATIGNTWHDDRPTGIGWGAIALALFVFVATSVKTFNEDAEKKRIGLVACQQVVRGTFNLLTPFAILVADASRNGDRDEALEGRLRSFLELDRHRDSSEMGNILDDLARLSGEQDYLTKNNINDHPTVIRKWNDTKWRYIFSTTAAKGIDELTNTLSSFQSVMDSRTIVATQKLRNIWLTQRIENLRNLDDAMSLQEFLRIGPGPSSNMDYYQEFIQAARNTIQLCSTASTS